MGHRLGWILAIAAAVAVITWSLLALRGPATSRAPARERGAAPAPVGRDAPAEGATAGAAAIRLAIQVIPPDSRADWTLDVRDSAGGVHTEHGAGAAERAFGSLPRGPVRCAIRAPGFLGETIRIEAIERRDNLGVLRLRRFGSVAGLAREGDAPVPGALVRLAMPLQKTKMTLELAPEDGEAVIEWTTETDADGGFRFEGIPPASGYTIHAAHFDYPVVILDEIRVAPGQETTVEIPMERAGHLAGRLVDHEGEPCAGVTVHIYEQQVRSDVVVGWTDEARVRTEKDGRFVTPALRGTGVRLLKSWVLADDLHLVMQLETVPPEDGRKDVGDLRPLPGTVRFEAEREVGNAVYKLTVAAVGDPPGEGRVVALNGLAFTPEGYVRLAGLPAGECSYAVLNADDSAVCHGNFRVTGGDMVVRVPPFEAPAPPEDGPKAEWKRLVVHADATADEALLVVVHEGVVAAWRPVAKGQVRPVTMRLPAGNYRVYLSEGGRIGWEDVTHATAQDTTISLRAGQAGREVALRILRNGAPASGVAISIRGFRPGARGLHVPWAESGDDGRALLRGLPPDGVELEIVAMHDWRGRTYLIAPDRGEELALDLATQSGR